MKLLSLFQTIGGILAIALFITQTIIGLCDGNLTGFFAFAPIAFFGWWLIVESLKEIKE